MPKYFLILVLNVIGFSNGVFAQFGLSHEVGVILGPELFQSDYGLRYDLKTNSGNAGFGFGIIHYFNFSYKSNCDCYSRDTFFNDHFKIRSEISYNKTNLKHFGEWVAPNKTSVGAIQLRSMRGSTTLTNLGLQLEYFPFSIKEFSYSIGSFAPFVSLGAHYSFYDTKATSTIGTLGIPTTTFPKYLLPSDGRSFGFSTENGSVLSLVTSVGTRYKLSPLQDLMVDFRFQYFYSDWVDGLNPNPTVFPENKANDWLVWFSVGYIHYL